MGESHHRHLDRPHEPGTCDLPMTVFWEWPPQVTPCTLNSSHLARWLGQKAGVTPARARQFLVTSSSDYSSSSEVKAGSSEVGSFLELASARALCLPSVASRVFQTEVQIEFPEHAGMEKCTGMVPSTSTKVWEVEVQSSYSLEVCRMRGVELFIGRVE